MAVLMQPIILTLIRLYVNCVWSWNR
uniref:Uncharacterized protein n=1 Tax=Anguilla anguilla TaxID=7936 RepID=A0A0E9SWQ0_ANGAN